MLRRQLVLIMTNEEINYNSNMAYLVGYYEGRLKIIADEIKGIEGLETTLREIKSTLDMGEKIWDNKYEKHYSKIK